ncbi:MAG: GNAT family N-acetyltransferase [Anaerolineae bacterium]
MNDDSPTLTVPGAPAIPGLAFRRFRGEADYAAMVEILNACNAADQLDYVNIIDEIAWVFSHLTNCDPYRDMLFAEVNGTAIAFSRVWWTDEAFAGVVQRLYKSLGFVHPDWRRRGLGAAMLHYDEHRLRAMAQGHPPEMDKRFQVWATGTEEGARALFAAAGYEPVRHYIMMVRPIGLPLPHAPLPAGLEVRPAEQAQIRAIWEAMWEARRDHWGYVEPTAQEYSRWTKGRLFDPGLWKVAWDGGKVAGMVLNRLDEAQNEAHQRLRGYTQDVFVRRPWRRRGLARALLVQSIQMFRQMGMAETALGVDTENPSGALRLYESLDYREVQRHTFYDKAMD